MDNKLEAKKEFEYLINTYVLPLIPTKGLLKCKDLKKPASFSKYISQYKKVLKIYPCLENPQFFYNIEAEGENTSLGAALNIISELMKVSQFIYNDPQFPKTSYYDMAINGYHVYRTNRYNLAFEVGLCNWLGGTTVFRLLEKMRLWSQKTYEGKKIPFSFIIDVSSSAKGSSDFISFLDSNHSAVFTDGFTSGIALDSKGHIVKYFSATYEQKDKSGKNGKRVPFAPYRFRDFANKCCSDGKGATWVGIIAQTNGDILIFKNQALIFAKRSGKWVFLNPNKVINQIKKYVSADKNINDQFAKELYLSILDVAFSHSGGCIAVINEDYKEHVIKQYINHDYLDDEEQSDEKKKILKRLMIAGLDNEDRIFYQLDRKLRQDLLGLDGATVIDTCGKIIGSGAIVKIEGGSDEGGRTAAAKQLSCYGFSVKISMDGNVQGFHGENGEICSVERIFTML